MLGKLLKYEFKATARTLLPLYAALLIIALVSNFLIKSDFEVASIISVTVFGALLMAVFILTLILMIQRFRRNLLKDEGYLMFTLPVKVNRLIFSKLITTFVWFIAAWVVGGISGLLIGWDSSVWADFKEIWPQITAALSRLTSDQIGLIVNAVFFIILGSLLFILMVYTAISVGQLPPFQKHRRFFSFIAFVVIFIVAQVVFSTILPQYDCFVTTANINQCLLINNILMAAADVLLFLATNYILSKKLNLE